MARICQGAATRRIIATPLRGLSRLHTRKEKNWRVSSRYTAMAPIGKTTPIRLFRSKPRAEGYGEDGCPCLGVALVFIQHTKKGPQSQGDGEGEHRVRQKDAGEEPEPDASRHAKAGQESRPRAECPRPEGCGDPAKRDDPESNRNTRSPIMRAKNLHGGHDRPVEEGEPFPGKAHRRCEPSPNRRR